MTVTHRVIPCKCCESEIPPIWVLCWNSPTGHSPSGYVHYCVPPGTMIDCVNPWSPGYPTNTCPSSCQVSEYPPIGSGYFIGFCCTFEEAKAKLLECFTTYLTERGYDAPIDPGCDPTDPDPLGILGQGCAQADHPVPPPVLFVTWINYIPPSGRRYIYGYVRQYLCEGICE